jgi:hypothetical protein
MNARKDSRFAPLLADAWDVVRETHRIGRDVRLRSAQHILQDSSAAPAPSDLLKDRNAA